MRMAYVHFKYIVVIHLGSLQLHGDMEEHPGLKPKACRSVLFHAKAEHDFTGVESGQVYQPIGVKQ